MFKPEYEIVVFATQDIVTTSTVVDPDAPVEGEDEEL